MARRLAGIALALLAGVAPAHAQEVARFSADSVISVEQFAGHDTGSRLDLMTLDGFVALRLGNGWQAYVRPVLRRSRPLEWDAQICQAAVRYERRAGVAIRFDAGHLASPVGLGMLIASQHIAVSSDSRMLERILSTSCGSRVPNCSCGLLKMPVSYLPASRKSSGYVHNFLLPLAMIRKLSSRRKPPPPGQ